MANRRSGGILARPRLVEMLDATPAQLSVLSAPSGFGKTTLVRDWAGRLDGDPVVLWTTVSTPVSDPISFWTHLLVNGDRLGHFDDGAWREVVGSILAGYDAAQAVADLLNTSVGAQRRIVIVLDAYENVQVAGERIELALVALTQQLPYLRIVVTTRAQDTFAAVARRRRAEAQAIGPEALAFTRGEVESLLAVEGLDAAEAGHIAQATGGYPLALRAVLLGMRSPSGLRDDGQWRAAVAEELLGQFDVGIQEFVLVTAVPPYFDLGLARLLSGDERSGELLSELERHGVGRWIPFAPGRPVFQYVEVAREAFRTRVAATAPSTHARAAAAAARWFLEADLLEEALDLAVTGADYELASHVYRAAALSRPDTYISDRYLRYLARVPRPALVRHPMLAFGRALAMASNPATAGAASEFQAIAASHLGKRLAGLNWTEVTLEHAAACVSLRSLRRFDEAGAAAERAMAAFERVDDVGGQFTEFGPTVLRTLAYALLQVGRIDRAVELADRGIALTTTPPSRNYAAVYTVGFQAFVGRCRAARDAAALVDPAAWSPGLDRTFVNALGRIGSAILRLDDFDFAGALQEFEGCESFLSTAEFGPFITWTMLHAHLGLDQAASEAHRVAAALQRVPPPPGIGDNLGTDAVRGALAILWLAAGRRNAAHEVLSSQTTYPGQVAPARALARLLDGEVSDLLTALPRLERLRGHTDRTRSATLTIAAAAAVRAGNAELAGTLLRRCGAMYREGEARLHLTYLPPEDLAALRTVARERSDASITAYLEGEVPPAVRVETSVPVLSPREHQILQALVERTTRAEVAAALHVSENTVKTHLRGLYRKLGVNSREAALQRGIALDLLRPDRRRSS